MTEFKSPADVKMYQHQLDMYSLMSGEQWKPDQLRQMGKRRELGMGYGMGINQISGLNPDRVIMDEATYFLDPSARAWSKAFKQAYGTMPAFYGNASQTKRREIEAATEVLARKTSKAGRMAARVVAARVAFTLDDQSRVAHDDRMDALKYAAAAFSRNKP